jgi:hypothetical protein
VKPGCNTLGNAVSALSVAPEPTRHVNVKLVQIERADFFKLLSQRGGLEVFGQIVQPRLLIVE